MTDKKIEFTYSEDFLEEKEHLVKDTIVVEGVFVDGGINNKLNQLFQKSVMDAASEIAKGFITENESLKIENISLKRTVEVLDQEGVEKCEKLEKQSKQIKVLEKALEIASVKIHIMERMMCNAHVYPFSKETLFTPERWYKRFIKDGEEKLNGGKKHERSTN